MKKNFRKSNDAYRIVMGQLFAVILLFPFVHSFWDKETAVSVTLGGLICVLPNLFLYRCVFAHFGAQAAQKILQGFYFGELCKIILTAVLFSVAFNFSAIMPKSLLIGFVLTQCFFWLAPLYVVFIVPRVRALVY